MNIAKVTDIEDLEKTWESSHGTMYVFWVKLEDGTEGEVNCKSPNGPPYAIDDVVGYEIKKEYKGVKTLRIDKKAADGGGGTHPPARPAGPPKKSEPVAGQRRANSADPQSVYGGTVGMALKEAIALHSQLYGPADLVEEIGKLDFWKKVHVTASHIIRVSLALEAANLAPSLNKKAPAADEDRSSAPQRPPADPTNRNPGGKQPNGGAAFPPGSEDESVPF